MREIYSFSLGLIGVAFTVLNHLLPGGSTLKRTAPLLLLAFSVIGLSTVTVAQTYDPAWQGTAPESDRSFFRIFISDGIVAGVEFLPSKHEAVTMLELGEDGSASIPDLLGLGFLFKDELYRITSQFPAAGEPAAFTGRADWRISAVSSRGDRETEFEGTYTAVDLLPPAIHLWAYGTSLDGDQEEIVYPRLSPYGDYYFVAPTTVRVDAVAYDNFDGYLSDGSTLQKEVYDNNSQELRKVALDEVEYSSLGTHLITVSATDSHNNVATKMLPFRIVSRPFGSLGARLHKKSCERNSDGDFNILANLTLSSASPGFSNFNRSSLRLGLTAMKNDGERVAFLASTQSNFSDDSPVRDFVVGAAEFSDLDPIDECSQNYAISMVVAGDGLDHCPTIDRLNGFGVQAGQEVNYELVFQPAANSSNESIGSRKDLSEPSGKAAQRYGSHEMVAMYQDDLVAIPCSPEGQESGGNNGEITKAGCRGCLGGGPGKAPPKCEWVLETSVGGHFPGSLKSTEIEVPREEPSDPETPPETQTVQYAQHVVDKPTINNLVPMECVAAAQGETGGMGVSQVFPLNSSVNANFSIGSLFNPMPTLLPTPHGNSVVCNKLTWEPRVSAGLLSGHTLSLQQIKGDAKEPCCHNCKINFNSQTSGEYSVFNETSKPQHINFVTASILAGFAHQVTASNCPANPPYDADPSEAEGWSKASNVSIGGLVGVPSAPQLFNVTLPTAAPGFHDMTVKIHNRGEALGEPKTGRFHGDKQLDTSGQVKCYTELCHDSAQVRIANVSYSHLKNWYPTGATVTTETEFGIEVDGGVYGGIPIPGASGSWGSGTTSNQFKSAYSKVTGHAHSSSSLSLSGQSECEGVINDGQTFSVIANPFSN